MQDPVDRLKEMIHWWIQVVQEAQKEQGIQEVNEIQVEQETQDPMEQLMEMVICVAIVFHYALVYDF